MGRALKPTRRVRPGQVKVGDVALVRSHVTSSLRWMIVDYVVGFGAPHVWSGRWAFGGQWTIHTEHRNDNLITVKHRDDAARDAQRLAALRRSSHV